MNETRNEQSGSRAPLPSPLKHCMQLASELGRLSKKVDEHSPYSLPELYTAADVPHLEGFDDGSVDHWKTLLCSPSQTLIHFSNVHASLAIDVREGRRVGGELESIDCLGRCRVAGDGHRGDGEACACKRKQE